MFLIQRCLPALLSLQCVREDREGVREERTGLRDALDAAEGREKALREAQEVLRVEREDLLDRASKAEERSAALTAALEQMKAEEEQRKVEEEQRKVKEEQRKVEERVKAEEQRKAEEQMKAEEEQRKAEEQMKFGEQRKAEEEVMVEVRERERALQATAPIAIPAPQGAASEAVDTVDDVMWKTNSLPESQPLTGDVAGQLVHAAAGITSALESELGALRTNNASEEGLQVTNGSDYSTLSELP